MNSQIATKYMLDYCSKELMTGTSDCQGFSTPHGLQAKMIENII